MTKIQDGSPLQAEAPKSGQDGCKMHAHPSRLAEKSSMYDVIAGVSGGSDPEGGCGKHYGILGAYPDQPIILQFKRKSLFHHENFRATVANYCAHEK